jgi:phosphatidate cytidylyltransferase
MFVAIWGTDVFAYYGGKRFGKRPLSPISPKKTIEGTVVGIAAAMCLGLGITLFGYKPTLAGGVIFTFVSGVIGAVAQFGDLYESLIKRTYNVKDSSNLLPGHGGILDRADSTLFVAPMILLLILILDYI